jgi:hypothetical protein
VIPYTGVAVLKDGVGDLSFALDCESRPDLWVQEKATSCQCQGQTASSSLGGLFSDLHKHAGGLLENTMIVAP